MCASYSRRRRSASAASEASPLSAERKRSPRGERELREAAAIIGFDELHLLGYRDRELSDAPVDEMRLKLVALIRRTQPAVVFTFDPQGYNLPSDHVAISRFTSDAIAIAADPRWLPEAGDAQVVQRLLWTPPIGPWDMAQHVQLDGVRGADFRDGRIGVARAADRGAPRASHAATVGRAAVFDRPNLDRILGPEGVAAGLRAALPLAGERHLRR